MTQHIDESDDQSPTSGVIARRAADVPIVVPHWLWEKRIPIGKTTLLAGREGIGKSSVALALAAKVTRGDLPGRSLGIPRSVGVVATEDDWGSTIVPRLMAAGADLTRVLQLESYEHGFGRRTISLPDDLDSLGERCEELDIGFVVVDPIMSVLPSGMDTHKDREVRKALDPLTRFAQRSGVAVLGLIHVNKSTGTDPLNAIMGSKAFAAVARSVLFAFEDTNAEEDEDPFVLDHVKCNVGAKMPSIGYRLVEAKIAVPEYEDPRDAYIETSRAVLGQEDGRRVAEMLADLASASRGGGAPIGDLSKGLVKYIEAANGSVPTSELVSAFNEHPRANVENTLSRLAKNDRIDRPTRGFYQAMRLKPGATNYQPPGTSRSDRSSSSSSFTNTPTGTNALTRAGNPDSSVVGDDWPSIPPPGSDPWEDPDD